MLVARDAVYVAISGSGGPGEASGGETVL